MCDCYDAKCEHEGCNNIIPIHIGDFRYPREDVKAWCEKHIPKDEFWGYDYGVEVSIVIEDEDWDNQDKKWPKGTMFGIKFRDGVIRPSAEDIHVNIGECEELLVFRSTAEE